MTNIKKALKISGIAVATTAVASVTAYVTTNYLIKIALDREKPKVMQLAEQRISGSEFNNEFLNDLREAAER